MNGTSYFVTGTDTDVGKTIVTSALLLGLQQAGLTCMPMKPVQTGCTFHDGETHAPDLDLCLSLLKKEEHEEMCAYRYLPACSPHLAAQQAGGEIVMAEIVRCYKKLSETYTPIIVEGAGGVFVPLNEQHTMRDLMVQLELPVILTARTGLGTINHTLLSIEALRKADLTVAGVVFTDTHPVDWTNIEEDNMEIIENRGRVPVLGHIPYFEHMHDVDAARNYLTKYGTLIVNNLSSENHG
jgi:dethiobiotin synthetase